MFNKVCRTYLWCKFVVTVEIFIYTTSRAYVELLIGRYYLGYNIREKPFVYTQQSGRDSCVSGQKQLDCLSIERVRIGSSATHLPRVALDQLLYLWPQFRPVHKRARFFSTLRLFSYPIPFLELLPQFSRIFLDVYGICYLILQYHVTCASFYNDFLFIVKYSAAHYENTCIFMMIILF